MNLSILESNDSDPEPFQKLRSLSFVVFAQQPVMRLAINFDGETTLRTEEIHNVLPNTVLSPKSFAEDLSFLKTSPQHGLSSS